MPAHIHLVRHAQGHHNLTPLNHTMPDPLLTPLGITQCHALASSFPYTPLITHIVSSPLRRTLYTALESFSSLIEDGKRLKIIALPEIQETSDLPCDTGSTLELLQEEFGNGRWKDAIDLTLVKAGWNDKGIDTEWAPAKQSVERRSHKARLFLRDLANKHEAQTGEEAHIVVVTHGGLLHFLTEDWCGYEERLGTGWQNTEWRSYIFDTEAKRKEGVDMASLKEKEESARRRQGTEQPLTADEEREYAAVNKDNRRPSVTKK